MMKKETVAIYGGTFSPPHIGHIRAAEALSREICPDRLMVIVDNLPPHKEIEGGITAEHRLAMARLAFGHIPHAEISDMEIRRGGKSFTAQTLSLLEREDRELYFLCGTDMFLSLPTWREPAVIFEKAVICLVRREADQDKEQAIREAALRYEREYGARLRFIDAPVTEISSTELRSLLCTAPWRAEKLLPKGVLDYILENGIFRMDKEAILASLREDIRPFMSEKRYRHTLGVERMAASLASYFDGEVDLFYLRAAALLHDITKELSEAEQREILAKLQIKLSKNQDLSPAVFHSFTAEHRISEHFFVFAKHAPLIRAIRAHTTASADMSLFDKLLFVADYIEEGREYPRSIAERKALLDALAEGKSAKKALDASLLSILESTVSFLRGRGYTVCDETLIARDRLLSSISSH